jgi:hypothetical protein
MRLRQTDEEVSQNAMTASFWDSIAITSYLW